MGVVAVIAWLAAAIWIPLPSTITSESGRLVAIASDSPARAAPHVAPGSASTAGSALAFEADFVVETGILLAPGMPARIELTALPWIEHGLLIGFVVHVAPKPGEPIGAPSEVPLRVTIEIDRDSPIAARLAAGMQGQATLRVDETTLVEKLLALANPRPDP